MATKIVTAAELAQFLKITDNNGTIITPSGSTDPTLTALELIINGVEADFDSSTHHSWGALTTVTKEIHDLFGEREYSHGIPMHLAHRDVAEFNTGSGDKVERWDGTNWEDISSNNDFHLIESIGKLYIHSYGILGNREDRYRITYRYGTTTVPADIKLAILKKSAATILEGSIAMSNIQFGSDRGLRVSELITKWSEDYKGTIIKYADWVRIEY